MAKASFPDTLTMAIAPTPWGVETEQMVLPSFLMALCFDDVANIDEFLFISSEKRNLLP